MGVDISNLPIEEFSKLNYSFDLIMSFHVIEHLHYPLEVLKNLEKMLNVGGKMLMHIPIDDIELSNTDHFHFFTKQSAIKLMEEVVKEVEVNTSYYNISETESVIVGIKK
ncbi:MAG: class I SAM-dependent methyltransferase [Lachnospiraceae bacterium]|nr:class I SAM-dependent methyltransferase [Lachnospiraceae bacterium]